MFARVLSVIQGIIGSVYYTLLFNLHQIMHSDANQMKQVISYSIQLFIELFN